MFLKRNAQGDWAKANLRIEQGRRRRVARERQSGAVADCCYERVCELFGLTDERGVIRGKSHDRRAPLGHSFLAA